MTEDPRQAEDQENRQHMEHGACGGASHRESEVYNMSEMISTALVGWRSQMTRATSSVMPNAQLILTFADTLGSRVDLLDAVRRRLPSCREDWVLRLPLRVEPVTWLLELGRASSGFRTADIGSGGRPATLPAYISKVSSSSRRGPEKGRIDTTEGVAVSMIEYVEVRDLVLVGKAPRANKLLCLEVLVVEKNNGTTNVLPRAGVETVELFMSI